MDCQGGPDGALCSCCLCAEVKFGSRNVLADAAIREGIKKYSNWPTIPQVHSFDAGWGVGVKLGWAEAGPSPQCSGAWESGAELRSAQL